jgi:hypothetical protein
MRIDTIVCAIAFICLMSVEASGNPVGVWIPIKSDSRIRRIHISGFSLNYTATIDYRCLKATCSTLQSLIEDGTPHPSTFSVRLEGVGPTPMLVLRWQRGSPCNRPTSDENPFVFWGTTVAGPSTKTNLGPVGRPTCFVRTAQTSPR